MFEGIYKPIEDIDPDKIPINTDIYDVNSREGALECLKERDDCYILLNTQSGYTRKRNIEGYVKDAIDPDSPRSWDELVIAESPFPDDPMEVDGFPRYHVSPQGSVEGIKEWGIVPNDGGVNDGYGVFVTGREETAREWAGTLAAESHGEAWALWEIHVPREMEDREETDRNPINPSAVPNAMYIRTRFGFPPEYVRLVDEFEVDPDEYETGGL